MRAATRECMRSFTLLLALFMPACLTSEAPDEATADQAEIVVTPSPAPNRCPDTHADLPGEPQQCIVPNVGLGQRLCTDHVTFHYVPLISSDGKLHCVQTSTTTTTTCGPCVALTLPGGGL